MVAWIYGVLIFDGAAIMFKEVVEVRSVMIVMGMGIEFMPPGGEVGSVGMIVAES